MLTKNPFEGKSTVNIVFVGGSITEGAFSSSPDTCYVALCREWLKKEFPYQNINCYNAGFSGTGSDFGRIRMERDIMCHKPDMLFVEFAVNDNGCDWRAYMESIVQRCTCEDEVPYIVFLYTANNSYSVVTKYHREIAEYYGIPEIDLQAALKEALCGKDPTEEGYFKDKVHPLDDGFAVYAETICKRLSEDSAYVKPIPKAPMLPDVALYDVKFTPSTEFSHTDGWKKQTAHRGYDCLYSEKAGESIGFTFDGTFLAFEKGLHRESGVLDIYVDGELIKTESAYYDTASYEGIYAEVSDNLPEGHHKVVMTLREEKDPGHPGARFMVYHIITGRSRNVSYSE